MNENENIVNITENENIVKIEIVKDCSLIYFYNEISSKLTRNIMNQINMGSILEDHKIAKKCLYIIKKGNKVYNIATNIKENTKDEFSKDFYDYTYISEKTFENNCINETALRLLPHGNYSISVMIHNNHGASKSVNIYNKEENTTIANFYKLHKRPALKKARILLNNLSNIDDINSIISLDHIYNHLNLMPETEYLPIITDNTLTLSWKNKENKDNINKGINEEFDIVLNTTMEVIGDISFDYSKNKDLNHKGNVRYNIKPEYRNKHFASRSLKLLKEVLQKNQWNGKKDLYIATNKNNEYSQKVILDNEGKLIYEGKIPENEKEHHADETKEVKVYKIVIN